MVTFVEFNDAKKKEYCRKCSDCSMKTEKKVGRATMQG